MLAHETAARFQCVCFIVVTNVGQGNRRVGCPVNGMLVYPLSGRKLVVHVIRDVYGRRPTELPTL